MKKISLFVLSLVFLPMVILGQDATSSSLVNGTDTVTSPPTSALAATPGWEMEINANGYKNGALLINRTGPIYSIDSSYGINVKNGMRTGL